MIDEKFADFVRGHIGDDIPRLVLNREKWQDIDIDLAVSSIESRRKLKGKVQEWFDEPLLYFPVKLSAEQCSSSATGRYKAEMAQRIADAVGLRKWKVADLTGGLGVDSWCFSAFAEEVMYCEMQEPLCRAAEHNFRILGAENIRVRHCCVGQDTGTEEILRDFNPDLVYMDPARRGGGGKKVFLIEECTPDVLTMKDDIFRHCGNIMLKLSPMADISMVMDRLGPTCREIHIVASGGECKELIVWMDREWEGECSLHCAELASDTYSGQDAAVFSFLPSEEREAWAETASEDDLKSAEYLFEPGKALMKAGAYNLAGRLSGMKKLGRFTHYYIGKDTGAEILRLGKVFAIIDRAPLDKRSLRLFAAKFPKAEVTARNIPMDTDTLRKKMGITSGDDAHLFGLKSDPAGNILLAAKRIHQF